MLHVHPIECGESCHILSAAFSRFTSYSRKVFPSKHSGPHFLNNILLPEHCISHTRPDLKQASIPLETPTSPTPSNMPGHKRVKDIDYDDDEIVDDESADEGEEGMNTGSTIQEKRRALTLLTSS